MRIAWDAPEREGGDFYGFLYHSKRTREALLEIGVDLAQEADVVVHVRTPAVFEPRPGCFNVLDTHWEADRMTGDQIEAASLADLIIVSSEWVADVFRAHVPSVPVEVAPLGVDRCFAPRKRRWPRSAPFRFLWVGAPNPRKGYELLIGREDLPSDFGAWFKGFHRSDGVELYLKTSVPGEGQTIEQMGNVTFDSRRLSREDLVELYYSAHAFIFPTYSEGFGLTLAEAMATGCPAIFTPAGGVLDFAKGIELPFDLVDAEARGKPGGDTVAVKLPQAKPDGIAAAMQLVLAGYQQVRRKAYEDGRHVYHSHQWSARAERLVGILRRYAGQRIEEAA